MLVVGKDSWLYAVVAASDSGFLVVGNTRVPLCRTHVATSSLRIAGTVGIVTINVTDPRHCGPLNELCARAAMSFNDQSVVVANVVTVRQCMYKDQPAPESVLCRNK